MKRFMKGCAVTALLFVAIGFILGVLGSKMAGKDGISQAVESATDGKIHLYPYKGWGWHFYTDNDWMNAEFGNVGKSVDTGMAVDDWNEDSYEIVQDKDGMFDKKHDVIKGSLGKYCLGEAVKKLDIEVGGCQFYTVPSEDGQIYLEVGNAYRFQGYVEKETLYIRSKTASVQNWEEGDCWITLYLPEGYRFEKVEAEIGAGYLVFADLCAEEVSIEAGAGEIDVQRIDADKLDVSVGAGYVWLMDMQTRKLDAEIGLGGLTAEGAVYEKADIECSMGNVELFLEGREEDYNYKLEGAMGNIDLGDNSYAGLGTEKEINNHASREMEIECSMGNISISFLDD